MDSLTKALTAHQIDPQLPLHCVHVYRHIDSKNVESKAQFRRSLNKTLTNGVATRSPLRTVLHGDHLFGGVQPLRGGAR